MWMPPPFTQERTGDAIPASSAQLKARDLQNDVALLLKAFETLHPGLYRYNTTARMP